MFINNIFKFSLIPSLIDPNGRSVLDSVEIVESNLFAAYSKVNDRNQRSHVSKYMCSSNKQCTYLHTKLEFQSKHFTSLK